MLIVGERLNCTLKCVAKAIETQDTICGRLIYEKARERMVPVFELF